MSILGLARWFPLSRQMAELGRHSWFFAVTALVPLGVLHGWLSLDRPRYDFTPLALLGAAFLVRRELQSAPTEGLLRPWLSWSLASLSFLACLGALLLHSPWLIAAAMAIGFTAAVRDWLGEGWFRRAWIPIIMVAFTVPLPLGLDEDVALRLRNLTSRWGSGVLDLFQIAHILRGNVIEVPGQQLFVDEACSGVNSVFAVIVCCLFYLGLVVRGWIRALILAALSLVWVVVANVIRVVLVVASAAWGGPNLATGMAHDLLGATVFLVAVGLLVSADQFLLALVPTYGVPAVAEFGVDPRATTIRRHGRIGNVLFGIGIGALAIAFATAYVLPRGGPRQRSATIDRFNRLTENSLPNSLGSWERERFETPHRARNHEFGEYSRIWRYTRGSIVAAVSIDYPYRGWHNLDRCYQALGWKRDHREAFELPTDSRVEVAYHRSATEYGYLVFGLLAPDGFLTEPETDRLNVSLTSKLTNLRRFLHVGQAAGAKRPEFVCQVQVFAESPSPLTDEQKNEIRTLFREAAALGQRVLGGGQPNRSNP